MAAPTLDVSVTQGDTGTNSPTVFSHTTAAGATYMIVRVGTITGGTIDTVATITFGATSLAKLDALTAATNTIRGELWGGTVPDSTTANVTVTYNNHNNNAVAESSSYIGVVSVGTPVKADVTGSSSSLSLNSISYALAIDAILTNAGDANPAIGSGQATEFTRFNDGASQIEMDGSSKTAAAAMAWSSLTHSNNNAIHIAVELLGSVDPITGAGAFTLADSSIAGTGVNADPVGGPGFGIPVTMGRLHRTNLGF